MAFASATVTVATTATNDTLAEDFAILAVILTNGG